MMSCSWDQARWAVEAENGDAIEVETLSYEDGRFRG